MHSAAARRGDWCRRQRRGSGMEDLRQWFEQIGLSGKKMEHALQVCEDELIECVGDLQTMQERGTLNTVGLKTVVLTVIEAALEPASPEPSSLVRTVAEQEEPVDEATEMQGLIAAARAIPVPAPVPALWICGHVLWRIGVLRCKFTRRAEDMAYYIITDCEQSA